MKELDRSKLVSELAKKFRPLLITAKGYHALVEYLDYYGYLKGQTPDDVEQAIVSFQDFWGLKETGVPDDKTLRATEAFRCGVKDFLAIREFAKWRKNKLTYKVEKRDSDVTVTEWDNAIRKAWDNWQAVANLDITQTDSNKADIICSVGSGKADDFDGPSGTLAWAELPNGSDRQLIMKFDAAETWTISATRRGILLVNVACHEFGHSLGLEHSRKQTALMAPYYSANIWEPQQVDDIPRIQDYYGKPVINIPIPTPTPIPDPIPGGNKDMVIRISGTAYTVKVDNHRLTPISG